MPVCTEQAVVRAEAASRALFDRDLSAVKTADVLWALKGDPRLQYCSLPERLDTAVTKLATEHGLTTSNCKSLPQSVYARGAALRKILTHFSISGR